MSFLLFAVREVPSESLGFSPNELIFGHNVRGPLQLLKEAWVGAEGQCNLIQYVMDFKTCLWESWEFASKNLSKAQEKMKV